MNTTVSDTEWSSIFDALDSPHQYEGYIAACCPFHDDLRPSFFVYPDTYKCLACGAFGPTSKLLERMGKRVRSILPRSESSSINPFSHWMRERSLKEALHVAWQNINANPGLGNYIVRDRGVEEPYRKLLGIGYLDDWYTIPIRNRHGIIISAIARKGRDNPSTAKYVLPFNTNPYLLYVPNWAKVRDATYILITFGILDAIVIALLGYPVASTISGKRTSSISFTHFRIPILFLPDRREERDGLLAVENVGWRGHLCRVPWPEGCKDVNDIWVRDRALCRDVIQGVVNGTLRGYGGVRGAGIEEADQPRSGAP